MKITTFLLLLLVALAFTGRAQNLYTLQNAANIDNEANSTTGWSGPANIASVTGNPQNGTYSLQLTTTNSGRDAGFTFNAVVGTVYNISIWARKGANNANTAFENWVGFQNFTTTQVTSTSWLEYTFTLTATSTSPQIRVTASQNGPPGRQGYIDAITITAVAGDTQAPTAPTNLAASNTTTTSTTLNWSASTDNVGVTQYQIRRNNVAIGTVAGNITTYNATGLTASTTYNFNVFALDAAGNISPPSNTVQVTTGTATDTQAPTAPTNLAASNTTTTATTLNWSASTDNVGVTQYQIQRNNVAIGTVAGNITTYNATGLTAATTYSFNVFALDAAGNISPPSNTVQVTTGTATDTQAPTAPTNLAASNTTTTSTTLNWSASTDNVGVTQYQIRRNNVAIGTVAGNITTYNAAGLTASTTYSFNVFALDAAGNISPPSNTVQVTTSSGTGGGTPYTTLNANLPNVNWQAQNLYVSGSMGIGTTVNSNFRLSVNGIIRTHNLYVQSGWSDFVFKPDYLLPTLRETEQHIIEKGHLKDIPSAAQVQENGIGLAEINMRLLQKIEELTLYLIEAQKRLEILESER